MMHDYPDVVIKMTRHEHSSVTLLSYTTAFNPEPSTLHVFENGDIGVLFSNPANDVIPRQVLQAAMTVWPYTQEEKP